MVTGKKGEKMIEDKQKALRKFLNKGDYKPGGFGNKLVEKMEKADYTIEKVAYSAFYQTRLEYIMRALDLEALIIGGIVTNGGVASTVRDAHLRNVETILLSDGAAAFNAEVHDATLLSLGTVTKVMTCAETVALVEGTQ